MVKLIPIQDEDGHPATYSLASLTHAFPPSDLARYWSRSFKVADASGVQIEDADEDLLARAYEVLDDYEGGRINEGHGCSGQIISAAARLLRLGLHPEAVVELIEEELNYYIEPSYPDVDRRVLDAWRRYVISTEDEAALITELEARLGLELDED
jgi:hypothetical protein